MHADTGAPPVAADQLAGRFFGHQIALPELLGFAALGLRWLVLFVEVEGKALARVVPR